MARAVAVTGTSPASHEVIAMRSRVPSWTRALAPIVGLCVLGCGVLVARAPSSDLRTLAQQRLAQTRGRLRVAGLVDDVTVIRDRWGIPHIFAKNANDLFFAQGFVQAQDRLFQIDLWRRASQGRLAEILGPAYVERDRMNRLLAYRGKAPDWASYHPDGQAIIEQFVKGINAWVAIARENPPIEFKIAGYQPEMWQTSDLLSRGGIL